jgi:hypothetical protein
MPVHRVKGGWKFGNGPTVDTKAKAEAMQRAAYANGWEGDSRYVTRRKPDAKKTQG